eukprot:gene5689-6273_t
MSPVLFLLVAFFAIFANGFYLTPSLKARVAAPSMAFDLDKAAAVLAQNKILTKTARLGLLTKLEKAGFTLSSAAPLLKLVDKYDLLGVLEASNEKVLPLLAKAIDLTPSLLPLADQALKAPPSALAGGALASLALALGEVALIPDDSVGSIALQTLLFVPLGVVLPPVLGLSCLLLNKVK